MRTKKDTMRKCVHGAITKHIAFQIIYNITYFVQKVNVFVGFMMIFVKSSGRGFLAAAIVIGRLKGLEDPVRRPDDTVKGRLEGFQLFISTPTGHISERIVGSVQAQGAAHDIRHRFGLYFPRAAVCIGFFCSLGMQERVSDLGLLS